MVKNIIESESLQALIAQGQVMVFDCRFNLMDPDAGQMAYLESHIATARYVNLNKDLSSAHIPGETGRHPLPDKNSFINQVQRWGISPEKDVVVYDDAGGAFAARLWWLLRWIGHARVAVLNGGWQAWLSGGGDVSSQIPKAARVSSYDYAELAPVSRHIDVTDIDSAHHLLLDAREAKRFRGEMEPIDPVAGHIPGAFCSPMSENLTQDGNFKSPEELREKFSQVQERDKAVVCYCGSGVTAAHNILAMNIAGLTEPMLYAGSWSEWITDPARPIATDTE